MSANYHAAAAVVVMVASFVVGCEKSISERARNDQVTFVHDGDPAMNRAFEKARASLDEFFELAKSPKPGTQAYAVKVAVSDGKNTEYFWVNQFESDGEQLSGVLNNEPENVRVYRFGERFTFKRDDIVDWTYTEPAAGRTYGNFTACALLTHEDPTEAEEFKRQYGLLCE